MLDALLHNVIPNTVLPVLLPLALLLGIGAVVLARWRHLPVVPSLAWGVSLGVELAATLTPTLSHGQSDLSCTFGPGMWSDAFNALGVLNILMYVPLGFFGVLAFKRPLTNLAALITLTVATEITQGLTRDGRSCDGADMIDNALGAAIGVALAIIWFAARGHRIRIRRREVLRTSVALCLTLAGLGAVLVSTLQIVGVDDGTNHSPRRPDEAARVIAGELFGPHAHVTATTPEPPPPGDPLQHFSVTTDRGSFAFTWPQAHLVSYEAADHMAEPGTLTDDELLSRATEFVDQWFFGLTAGATRTFTPLGPGNTARTLEFRRVRDGVLMPMRLDLAITTSGRVMSASAVLIPDPVNLPQPVLTMADAEQHAAATTPGGRADKAFLLAKYVGGAWRLYWAVEVASTTQRPAANVFVDATTGDATAP